MHARLRLVAALLFATCGALAACGDGAETHHGHGVVRDVSREYEQIVIAHDDIPGLMPAMTMNFDVADPEMLSAAREGQRIEFDVEYSPEIGYRIVRLAVVGEGDGRGGGSGLGRLAALEEAPAFSLINQAGDAVSLADLRGQAVLLDFIFTRCPGPCPILTGMLEQVQKRLSPRVRANTTLVSISLDPLRDTPAVLESYARKRGLDLSDWSFLTGPPEEVETVLADYGVGATRQPDGTLVHVVAIFLIDPDGRIVERYVGLDHSPAQIARDVARVLARGGDAPS